MVVACVCYAFALAIQCGLHCAMNEKKESDRDVNNINNNNNILQHTSITGHRDQ